MGTKDRNKDAWRDDNTNNGRGMSGPGAHDDIAAHGHSSEYGANFRDASMQGNDRHRFGANDRRPSNFNEHFQGNDAGTPYRQNRDGQGGGAWPAGNEQRYGREQDRDNRFGFAEGGYRGENAYGAHDYNRTRGVAQTKGSGDWHASSATPGQRDETVMQKVGRFFGVGPKGYTRSDTRIQEDVSDALMDDHDVDATHIEVMVKESEVTLEGYVEDRATKRRAEDVVCNVRGVKDCHNHLRIRPLSQATIASTMEEPESASNAAAVERKDRNRQSSIS